jgi:hypothetical protein
MTTHHCDVHDDITISVCVEWAVGKQGADPGVAGGAGSADVAAAVALGGDPAGAGAALACRGKGGGWKSYATSARHDVGTRQTLKLRAKLVSALLSKRCMKRWVPSSFGLREQRLLGLNSKELQTRYMPCNSKSEPDL